ncbi:hypothetical protein OC846_006023 [Tilletia horrida]|uniref:Uncharacterized protein n=1 Tax=Tilletia horrida TaxID=155126 RepID=A0AAN6GLY3_9BASI|nr:hypothetical protein OC845_006031 [Tilletia horrida]KAK0544561.1 hypothetical protein OC846_006023 [Tilletia horrida]KAK0560718.1 hypothetical protein OC861_006158 [Tilletia horrida]
MRVSGLSFLLFGAFTVAAALQDLPVTSSDVQSFKAREEVDVQRFSPPKWDLGHFSSVSSGRKEAALRAALLDFTSDKNHIDHLLSSKAPVSKTAIKAAAQTFEHHLRLHIQRLAALGLGANQGHLVPRQQGATNLLQAILSAVQAIVGGLASGASGVLDGLGQTIEQLAALLSSLLGGGTSSTASPSTSAGPASAPTPATPSTGTGLTPATGSSSPATPATGTAPSTPATSSAGTTPTPANPSTPAANNGTNPNPLAGLLAPGP